jgi:hypothetical protein
MTSKSFCKILGIGHPRTGTGFTSKLLTAWGVNVGHEVLNADGIVAWQLIHSKGKYPFMTLPERPEYSILIYTIRNPLYSIPSIVCTEDINKKSLNFRKKVLGFKIRKNPIETAIDSLIAYDIKARELNPFPFRIERDQISLFSLLQKDHIVCYNNYNEIYK